jgi:YD repeat-containing protein
MNRWPHAATGLTAEAGVRYGTYAYDAQDRVTRSELAGGRSLDPKSLPSDVTLSLDDSDPNMLNVLFDEDL